jgi:hypothetical protein
MSVSRHHSRNRASQSRPRSSRNPSIASVAYLPQAESLFIPGGAVSEEATGLLQDFVHPCLNPEDTLIDEEQEPNNDDTDADGERKARANLPWWKRPSPLWYVSCGIQTDLFMDEVQVTCGIAIRVGIDSSDASTSYRDIHNSGVQCA